MSGPPFTWTTTVPLVDGQIGARCGVLQFFVECDGTEDTPLGGPPSASGEVRGAGSTLFDDFIWLHCPIELSSPVAEAVEKGIGALTTQLAEKAWWQEPIAPPPGSNRRTRRPRSQTSNRGYGQSPMAAGFDASSELFAARRCQVPAT